MSNKVLLSDHLAALYGESVGEETFARLQVLMERYRTLMPHNQTGSRTRGTVSERDAILITYGDQVRAPQSMPLHALADFCETYLTDVLSAVHILPFFPYSSDDGFSVIDYRRVDPALGTWEDVARLGRSFRLMFDAVINHISVESAWFRGFLRDDPAYRDYFVVVEGNPDLSQVVRPRALPLLTRFETAAGEKAVWTTFSEDQVDLNFQNPTLLLDIIDVLLLYAAQGAEFIRLDAIAFLWKEIGTSCLHLPRTHEAIRLFRAVLDDVAPHVLLITETNVPHKANISYFGDGRDEAQLVYNFALPPLTLHTFQTGDARVLSAWAAGLSRPSAETTFFNFLASHDGIGLNPARQILPDADIDAMLKRVQAHGGLISYKTNPDGSESPYEMNINYFDALNNPLRDEGREKQVDRFMAAQSIMLSLVGVPGIYFHSLFGSRGWPDGAADTGRKRTINREKNDRATLARELADPTSRRARVFSRYAQMLKARATSPAFDPHGGQRVIDCGPGIFALARTAPRDTDEVICLCNVTEQRQTVALAGEDLFGLAPRVVHDLLDGGEIDLTDHPSVDLDPYQVLWLYA